MTIYVICITLLFQRWPEQDEQNSIYTSKIFNKKHKQKNIFKKVSNVYFDVLKIILYLHLKEKKIKPFMRLPWNTRFVYRAMQWSKCRLRIAFPKRVKM